MSFTSKNYYEVLGVDRNADADSIKKAYRKMAMRYHPDKNQGDKESEKMFQQVAEAYEVLSDPQEKAYYDQVGSRRSASGGHRRTTVDPRDVFRSAFGGGGFDFSFEESVDPFGRFSGFERNFAPRSHVSPDNRIIYRTTIEKLLRGEKVLIQFKRQIACVKCQGMGFSFTSKKCPSCGGNGQIKQQSANMLFIKTCGACQGTGNMTDRCLECHETGYTSVEEKVSLVIPDGIKPMSVLRLKGKGNEIVFSQQRLVGDTYVVIDYPRSHEGVVLDDGNLYISVNIPFDTVMGQKKIKINVLGCRELELELDSTKRSGYQYKIAGAGVTKKDDAFIKVLIDFPKNKISKEDRDKLVKILRDIYGRPVTTFDASPIDY